MGGFTMTEMISSFDGTKLFLNREIPEGSKAIAVIVHGLAEHQGRYDYVAQKLHERGFGTYRFDHRGHGRSEGERTYFDDFNQPIDDANVVVDLAIAENPGLPVFLIGHSMGGFTVSLYGAKYPDKGLAGIVTSGALTFGTNQLQEPEPVGVDPHTRMQNSLGSGVCSVQEVVDWYGKDPLNEQSYTVGLMTQLRRGVLWFRDAIAEFRYPVLMMHGEKDALVNVEDTYQFFRNVPSADKQMKIFGGLFHEIFNEYCKDEVIEDAVRWMERRIHPSA